MMEGADECQLFDCLMHDGFLNGTPIRRRCCSNEVGDNRSLATTNIANDRGSSQIRIWDDLLHAPCPRAIWKGECLSVACCPTCGRWRYPESSPTGDKRSPQIWYLGQGQTVRVIAD
jgi:hypothetical protein